jgi:hypothetical protein
MKNKNIYEQIIESLINDDEARARELFHTEIVRQSRDIYNQLVVEEAEEEEEEEEEMEESFGSFGERGMSTDQTDDMLSDIDQDQEGMGHEMGDHDEEGEMGMDDMGSHDEGSIEDRVVDLEDALDELRAEFEELMSDEEGEEEHSDMDFGGEEDEPAEGMVREYVEKVAKPGNTEGQGVGAGSIGGGTNAKSIVAGKNDMGGKAFKLGDGSNENPDDKQYKKPSNAYTKGEGNLKGAGSFENVPGARASKTFKNAKKPVTSEVAGTNDKPMLKRQ